ncbi:MAG: hypothetical protein GKR93_04480 [Gammaproteobacteria bacterium]|nr:hypothetical protein [Gammaproteobacteria bacterium]
MAKSKTKLPKLKERILEQLRAVRQPVYDPTKAGMQLPESMTDDQISLTGISGSGQPPMGKQEIKYNLDWLRGALQSACEIELFTIPPYLYALWSIKDQEHYAAKSIRKVVMEEMQHLGMVCNLLKAIGATPDLTSEGRYPEYPEDLPDMIHSELEIGLSPFSKTSTLNFMEIERPYRLGQVKQYLSVWSQESYNTIGQLYDAIAEAFKKLEPDLQLAGQITGPRAPMAISSVEQAISAINQIKTQGEGSIDDPNDPDGGLAHYYSFGELHHGNKFDRNTGKWTGEAISEAETFDILDVPKGGFERNKLPPQTTKVLDDFNILYYDTIKGIETAWRAGRYPGFMSALENMFSLITIARDLMENHHLEGKGLGPEFLLRSE